MLAWAATCRNYRLVPEVLTGLFVGTGSSITRAELWPVAADGQSVAGVERRVIGNAGHYIAAIRVESGANPQCMVHGGLELPRSNAPAMLPTGDGR